MLTIKINTFNKKIFSLSKSFDITILKRGYPTKSLLTHSWVQKVLSPQVITEESTLLRNKLIFLRYCKHFKDKSLSDLLNDKIFIQYMNDLVHKEPSLYSRAFQLALEVTYSRRRFNEKILQEIYKHDFIISDTFNINNGLCDQSTVYTSILAKKVVDYFNIDSSDLIVNSTPIFLTKEKITNTMQILMSQNKKMTDNTCPDITLKAQPYDFKDSKDFSYGKNQIYFIDKELLEKKGIEIFKKLEQSLEFSKKHLSTEAQEFTDEILKSLREHKQTNSSMEIRTESLNKLLLKYDLPKDFKMPIFIPIRKAKIEALVCEDPSLYKVPLDKGHLDAVKAKKAIMGILEPFETQLKQDIQEMTHNSIQFTLPKIEEID